MQKKFKNTELIEFVQNYPAGADRFIDEMKRVVKAGKAFFPETRAALSLMMRREYREKEVALFEENPTPVPAEEGEIVVYSHVTGEGSEPLAILQGPGAKSSKLWIKYRHDFRWSPEKAGFERVMEKEDFIQVLRELSLFGFTVVPKKTARGAEIFEDFPRYIGQKAVTCHLGAPMRYDLVIADENSTIRCTEDGSGHYRTLAEAKAALNAYLLDQAELILEFMAFVGTAAPKDLGSMYRAPDMTKSYEVIKNGINSSINYGRGEHQTFSDAKTELLSYLRGRHSLFVDRIVWLGTSSLADFSHKAKAQETA